MRRETLKSAYQNSCTRGVVLTGLAAVTMVASADEPVADIDFVPNEIIVSDPDATFLTGITDMEFDGLGRFGWVDREGTVWVAKVDRETGLFEPPDGFGTIVDSGVVTTGELGNGPEWVFARGGPALVYTRDVGGTRVLARAQFLNNQWYPRLLGMAADCDGPLGSLDRGDPRPTISYRGPEAPTGLRPQFVRELADPFTEQMVPTTDEFKTTGMRWVEGHKWAVFSRPMPDDPDQPARRQAFLYDMDEDRLEQLTFDAGAKQAVFMWKAPEFDNELIFLALTNEKFLGIYRNLDADGDGTAEWTRVQTIDPPGLDYIWSPEPFVFDGKSYIVMTTSPSSDQQSITIPTETWIADLEPENRLYRRLSDDRELVRKDPEVYVTRNGPYVYILAGGDGSPDIHRLDTGLGPQLLAN